VDHIVNATRGSWPKLIMVHGLMESGKSTLAGYLMTEHGYRRVKFADTLKNMIRHILRHCGVTSIMIEGYLEGDFKKTPIPELNDPSRPEFHLENLPDTVIAELVAGLLFEAGLSQDRINYYVIHPDLPIQELHNVTTSGRLFDTLRNDWSRSMLKGEIVTSRRMMQTLGEEWRNLHSPKLWAYISLSMSETLIDDGHDVVIDDNRYRFEFEPFAHLRYFRFVVTRGEKHFLPVDENTHQSEIPMPVTWFDGHLRNDGPIQDLYLSADRHLNAFSEYMQAKATL
jgi:hypothetical protein